MSSHSLQEFPTVVVTAGIIFQQGKFLLTRRKLDAHQGGLWEFPGGKQKVEETLEQCLRRELKEELDVEIAHVKLFHVLRHCYSEKEVELHFFTCSISQGVPKPLDCLEMAWVAQQDLSLYEFPAADFPVLEKILQERFEASLER